MKYALGEDWESIFNICIANCRHPLFATTEAKFRQYEERVRGDSINMDDMFTSEETIFLEGNAKTLTDYFKV